MQQRNDVRPQPPAGWPLWTWTALIVVVAVAVGGAITYRSMTKAAARDALANAVSAKPNADMTNIAAVTAVIASEQVVCCDC